MESLSTHIYSTYETKLLVLWLIKDMTWILVNPYLCIPAGVAVVVLSCYVVIKLKEAGGGTVLLRSAIELTWLTGNVAWMVADLVFDNNSYSYHLGYRMVPMIGNGWDSAYHAFMCLAVAFFAVGSVAFLFLYAEIIYKNISGPSSDREVFGVMSIEDFKHSFLGFWILKDLIWVQTGPTHDGPYALALVFGVIAFVIVAESMRRFLAQGSEGWELYAVMLLWISVNTIWMTAEIPLASPSGESLPMLRFLASAILFVGIGITLRPALSHQKDTEDAGSTQPLLSNYGP